jgi:molybdenum cofactor cytidylyltransferase
MSNIPHLLLAAGTSKRMGEPKQLLKWADKLLIQHQVETLVPTTKKLYVVLGAYADQILPQLNRYDITPLWYSDWEKGMGNSLAFAVQQLKIDNPLTEGVLISLIDQPLISSSHYQKMRAAFFPGTKQIIASESDTAWVGVPVLFDAYYLDQLEKLKGEEGAKTLLKKHRKHLVTIPGGDTLADTRTNSKFHRKVFPYDGFNRFLISQRR